jgi:hypothetical protein
VKTPEVKKTAVTTRIMNHPCRNEGQDKLYGPGRRVFNRTADKSDKEYRCTVCGGTVKL